MATTAKYRFNKPTDALVDPCHQTSRLRSAVRACWFRSCRNILAAGGKEPVRMSARRRSWLTEPCPAWCSADHEGQDHPADRYHCSPQVLVPAIVPMHPKGYAISVQLSDRGAESTEFSVVALQQVGNRAQV